jgi:hypothetical protein
LHLKPGSPSDNSKDRWRAQRTSISITLPDGRLWWYHEARATQTALYEARAFQRVWAGDIPTSLQVVEKDLSVCTPWRYPGRSY